MKKYVILFFLGTLLYQNSFSQGITINAKVDSAAILIGDQIKYSISVTKPINESIEVPYMKDSISSGIELIELLKTDTVFLQAGMHTLRYSYLITSFDSGIYEIVPPPFIWKHDTVVDSLYTNPVFLTVNTVQVDTTQNAIMDIKPPLEAPFSWDEILPWILWSLLGIAIVAAAIYIFLKIKRKQPIIPIPEKPKPKPHVVALQKLDELKGKKLWQNNQIKKYHIELTDVVRTYIEERFQLSALEKVSSEILDDCKHHGEISDDLLKALKQILPLADLVKFAKFTPLPDENETSMKNAYYFVENTIPTVVEDKEMPKQVNTDGHVE